MSYAPALLLLLFTAWAGTFEGAASATGATVGGVVLTVFMVWAGLRLDPLGLGRTGRYLLAGGLVALAASAAVSPVTRAGLEGLLLLPAWLLLPAAFALGWRRRETRRRGLVAVAWVLGAVSLWALADWIFTETPRPSVPLGHHNLTALWLVSLLPLVAPLLRRPGIGRWVGATAGILAVGTILATRSLAGIVALGLLLVGLGWLERRRGRPLRWSWIVGAATVLLVALGTTWPRIVELASGRDPSVQARTAYLRAGWDGLLERPISGWGPGSTSWTLALHLDPIPGVNPPSEVVGQVHSLPLQIAYEAGLPAFLLGLAVLGLFGLRRIREARRGGEMDTVGPALLGLGAGAVASLGTAGLSVTALPLAWCVAAGAALAASGPPGTFPRPDSRSRTAALVMAALMLVALLPWLRARHLYERAAEAQDLEATQRRLDAAVELDPKFPLYRARRAWAAGSAPEAYRAAVDAVGVAPLWLQAGVSGLDVDAGWAGDSLRRACRLDPLSAFPPWFLAASDPSAPGASEHAARAVLLEPRLTAALLFETHPELRYETAREIARRRGVDPGLRDALGRELTRVEAARPEDAVASLVMSLESRPDQPFALHAFRRLSWPARLAAVPVRAARAGAVEIPSAATRPETEAGAFDTVRGCR